MTGKNFGGETLCEDGVITEVSTGVFVRVWGVGGGRGRVILTGKSQRENTIWWHRL